MGFAVAKLNDLPDYCCSKFHSKNDKLCHDQLFV